ncbi:MAG: hypothetical protein HY455_01085 [Parcubacteria group bacterium]|nr:hypothetical protein [Parcubacteria group bacterium]
MKNTFEGASKPEEGKKRLEDIEELKGPIEVIFGQLAESIERGEWPDLIVGDDASGRIPTLIVAGVLKEIAEARGLEKPDTLFFAGVKSIDEEIAKGRRNKILESLKQLEKRKDRKTRRALLITDTLVTGGTIQDIADAIVQEARIPMDIVTIAAKSSADLRQLLKNKLGARSIIFGRFDKTPGIYGAHTFGGVEKADRVSIHAQAMRKDPDMLLDVLQDSINQARADAKSIAHEIAEAYLAKHPQKEERKRAA